MKKHRKLWLLAGAVLALAAAFFLVTRPVVVDPAAVTSAEVAFTGDSLTVLPLGDYNPHKRKTGTSPRTMNRGKRPSTSPAG